METTSDEARSALAEIQRGRDAAWVPRRVPGWYWWSLGLAVGGFWALQDVDHHAVRTASAVLYAVVLGTILTIYFRKTGFRPRFGRGGPKAMQRQQLKNSLTLVGAVGAVGALVWVSGVPHGWLVMGAVAFLMIVTLGPLTDRWYARAWASWQATR
jgi:hypothetical protein